MVIVAAMVAKGGGLERLIPVLRADNRNTELFPALWADPRCPEYWVFSCNLCIDMNLSLLRDPSNTMSISDCTCLSQF
jgi:hypothetical protein